MSNFLSPELSPKPQNTEPKKEAQVEVVAEKSKEAGQAPKEQPQAEVATTTAMTVAPPQAVAVIEPPKKDPISAQIEKILEEDLTDVFLKLTPAQQTVFKKRGEVVMQTIRKLVGETKVQVVKIFELIKKWLHTIPGINRFYLEQEAKIKTDKILFYAEEERRRGNL